MITTLSGKRSQPILTYDVRKLNGCAKKKTFPDGDSGVRGLYRFGGMLYVSSLVGSSTFHDIVLRPSL